MGKYRFERLNPVEGHAYNIMNFDSSPSGSLNRMFGWRDIELRQTGTKHDLEVYYDVYGRHSLSSRNVVKLGTLREKTDKAIWEAL